MPSLRQNVEKTPDGSVWVRSFPVTTSAPWETGAHAHDWHQLTYAIEGTVRVTTGAGLWLVPQNRAVFLPAGQPHSEKMTGPVTLRSLYLARPLSDAFPRDVRVIPIGPLLRELILEACRRVTLDMRRRVERSLAMLITHELKSLDVAPLAVLPALGDPRARRMARLIQDNPGTEEPLESLARRSGASRRTLERLFLAETGLTVGAWRRRCLLIEAAERLAGGTSVEATAFSLGYRSPSAFIAMFRRELGLTPTAFHGRSSK